MGRELASKNGFALISIDGISRNRCCIVQGLKSSFLVITKIHRVPVVFVILAICSHAAVAVEPAYRLVRCVAMESHGFAVSFLSERNEQRHISFSLNKVNFGGTLKGVVNVDRVKELRLSPELQVVFSNPEHASLKFGPLSRECRDVIRNQAGAVLKVVDDHG